MVVSTVGGVSNGGVAGTTTRRLENGEEELGTLRVTLRAKTPWNRRLLSGSHSVPSARLLSTHTKTTKIGAGARKPNWFRRLQTSAKKYSREGLRDIDDVT